MTLDQSSHHVKERYQDIEVVSNRSDSNLRVREKSQVVKYDKRDVQPIINYRYCSTSRIYGAPHMQQSITHKTKCLWYMRNIEVLNYGLS